jgi:hypothetical protein
MARDCWESIEKKLESAESHLREAGRAINPELPSQMVAAQLAGGVDVSDLRWRENLSSHVSAFLVDCRSVPDLIQSCFGVDSNKWVKTLAPDEQRRRKRFQKFLRYKRFVHLPLSRARVDTVHRQGFAEIWVRVGKRYILLQELVDVKMKHILAGSDPALQWAATLPPQRARHLPSDFFYRTVGGRYKPLFPERLSYLRETRELLRKARQFHKMTCPPEFNPRKS